MKEFSSRFLKTASSEDFGFADPHLRKVWALDKLESHTMSAVEQSLKFLFAIGLELPALKLLV